MAWEALGLGRRVAYGRSLMGLVRETRQGRTEQNGSAFGLAGVQDTTRNAAALYLAEVVSPTRSESSLSRGTSMYAKSHSNLSSFSSFDRTSARKRLAKSTSCVGRAAEQDTSAAPKARRGQTLDFAGGSSAHDPHCGERPHWTSDCAVDGEPHARIWLMDEAEEAERLTRELERHRRVSMMEMRAVHMEYGEDQHMWRHKSEPHASFFDSAWGRTTICAVLVLDLTRLGFLADAPSIEWDVLAAPFAVCYAVELACRLWALGLRMFRPAAHEEYLGFVEAHADMMWNIYAVALVCLGAVEVSGAYLEWDMWRGTLLNLRLLRGLRFFTVSDKLRMFGAALLDTAQHLTWIFIFFGIVSFAVAILFKTLLDHIDVKGSDDCFSNVPEAVYSLFQITTMDNWELIARPFLRHSRLWTCFFIGFIIFNSYVMISLLNALVCERVMSATGLAEIQAEDTKWHKLAEFALFLQETFAAADSNGDGVLDKQEFVELIREEEVTHKIDELGVHISPQELEETFDMLDVDESNELSIEEFSNGICQLNQDIGMKHILAINCLLQRFYRQVSSHIDEEARRTNEQLDAVAGCLDALESRLVLQASLSARIDSIGSIAKQFEEGTLSGL